MKHRYQKSIKFFDDTYKVLVTMLHTHLSFQSTFPYSKKCCFAVFHAYFVSLSASMNVKTKWNQICMKEEHRHKNTTQNCAENSETIDVTSLCLLWIQGKTNNDGKIKTDWLCAIHVAHCIIWRNGWPME